MLNSKIKRVFIQGNILKTDIGPVVEKLYDLAMLLHIEVYFDHDIAGILPDHLKTKITEKLIGLPEKQIDVAFSLGGDGTVLRSMQKILTRDIPILPLNMGGLGFLTEITLDEFGTKLKDVLEGNFYFDERAILKTKIQSSNDIYFGLNDAVIDKAGFARVIFIHTTIDGQYFNNYIGDGLIVSTPTGSTGYSLSCGGPILMPNMDALIISPICPHSLTNRPVVISSDQTIEVEIFTDHDKAQLIIDGQHKKDLVSGDRLEISKSDYKIRLIRHPLSHFFNILRSKLHWGEDIRTKERWAQKINKSL